MGTLIVITRAIFFALTFACVTSTLFSASIGTQWEGLAHVVAGRLESYAKTHGGQMPGTLDELYTGIDEALLKEQLGGPVSSKILYYGSKGQNIAVGSDKILALLAFPINEDRRAEVGRYLIYRTPDGRVGSRWESDNIIRSAMAKVNLTVPEAPTYQEKPIKPLYPEYAMRLIEDAVKHGIPMEKAVKIVEKHIDDVVNRRAKQAKTWAEITASPTPDNSTPIPDRTVPDITSQATPGAQASHAPGAPATEKPQTSSVIALTAGILLLLAVVVGFIVYRRKS
jgi:hypothetical protein